MKVWSQILSIPLERNCITLRCKLRKIRIYKSERWDVMRRFQGFLPWALASPPSDSGFLPPTPPLVLDSGNLFPFYMKCVMAHKKLLSHSHSHFLISFLPRKIALWKLKLIQMILRKKKKGCRSISESLIFLGTPLHYTGLVGGNGKKEKKNVVRLMHVWRRIADNSNFRFFGGAIALQWH